MLESHQDSKMKFTSLRQCIKSKNVWSPHILLDCDLVVDGDSFFKDSYRNSGCQYILGPECDRYADFIRKKLTTFLDSNIKCHFIFKGVTKSSMDKRKEIHESIICHRTATNINMVPYFQPLFVRDVQKQILEEMDIKYFVCEYDSMEAIIGVATKLKCPVLTDKIEYSLFVGVSCIPTKSVLRVNGSKSLICTIYENEKVKNAFGVYNKTPMLLALLNENGAYFENLKELIVDMEIDAVWPVVKWVKRQREATLVSTVLKGIYEDKHKDDLKVVYERIQTLYVYPLCNLAVKYFQRDRVHGLFPDDKKWFVKGVSNGRIAPAYIHLKKEAFLFGSTLMYDSKRPDALLAAFEIVSYSHCLLTNSQSSTITFIGRQDDNTVVQEISRCWVKNIRQRGIFTKLRDGKKLKANECDVFKEFVEEVLPGFNFSNLELVPSNCWLLIITLFYYILKKNKSFIDAAYCILLSYIVLGPVSKRVDKLKKAESESHIEMDCMFFYNNLKFMFEKADLSQKYNSSVVSSFLEFQHCLQHINYLNKLCGEKIPCTVYHKTYNATFIFNLFTFIENKNHLMEYLESKFAGSFCLKMYKNVVDGFEKCLKSEMQIQRVTRAA